MVTADMDGPAVFISYAHRDRAAAHEIAFGLQKRGCDVWIDQGELSAGDSLIERLAAALAEVEFVVPLISEHSVDSPWCRRELSMAMTDEIDLESRFGVKRVLPLRLGEVEMPKALRDKLYREVDDRRPGDIVPRLWEDIRRHLDSASAPTASATGGKSGQASYERGRNLYDKGELAAARRHLHDASQESHHGAALLLGEILYDQGETDKAADEWQFAAGSSQAEIANAAVIHYGRLLAGQEFASGKLSGPRGPLLGGRSLAEAEALWRRAGESGHRDAAWAWLGLGRLLEDPGERGAEPDLHGAVEAFDSAARAGHGESSTYALFKLGRLKFKRGESEEATSVLSIGATSGNRDWSPWCAFELGRVHWSREEDGEAFRWWHEAATAGHPRISESAQEALDDPNSIWRMR